MPKIIITHHKIRDYKICRLYVEEAQSQEEIGKLFNLSQARIGQILKKNKALLTPDKEWEKYKRINWLKRQTKKRGDTQKDSLDLLDRLRVEIEGEKPTIDISKHISITKIQVTVSDDTKIPLTQESRNGIPSTR